MKKIGLVPKIAIGIVLGVLIGSYLPVTVIRITVTFATLFGEFLKFIVPLMILAYVIMGIADLSQGAGKLLGITTVLSYTSTIVAGFLAFIVAINLFPSFIDSTVLSLIGNPEEGRLAPFFKIDIPPILDVTSALVFSFIMGLCISTMKGNKIGYTCYNFFSEFSEIITKVLNTIIVPLLPLFILGTFANMTYSGETVAIVSVLWRVFAIVICLHLLYLTAMFLFAGGLAKKNPFRLIRNQVPGWLAAVGTQSSAACIPVNIGCAEKNGTSKEIREFVIPLCSTIHMAGSIITITSCVTAVLMIFDMPYDFKTMFPLILALGVAMVASPGAPGGAIMSALPFLPIVGINSEGAIARLLIALYITQDSFGTAANVSGDNAIAVMVDVIYKKFIKKSSKTNIEEVCEEMNT